MSNKTNLEPEVWFIHGANASPTSFAYIQQAIQNDDAFKNLKFVNVRYDCQEPIAGTIEGIANSIPDNKPVYLIGHSMGGILAVAAAQRIKHFGLNKQIKAVITMASPLGGCESADYLQWLFPHYHLFKNISTKNKVINDLKAVDAVVPTLNLITTSGNNPMYHKANDGVVTISSQRALRNTKKIEVPYNHFELLLSDDTVSYIKSILLDADKFFGFELSAKEV